MTDAPATVFDQPISPLALRLLAGAVACMTIAAIIILFQNLMIERISGALHDRQSEHGHKFAVGFLQACGEPCVIRSNYGGVLADFRGLAEEVNARKQVILIDGDCVSACALFADLARANIRITLRARIWFHQSSAEEIPPQSPDIISWVTSNGGFPTFESGHLTLMRFDQARRFWQPAFEWTRLPRRLDAPWHPFWLMPMPTAEVVADLRGTVQ